MVTTGAKSPLVGSGGQGKNTFNGEGQPYFWLTALMHWAVLTLRLERPWRFLILASAAAAMHTSGVQTSRPNTVRHLDSRHD